MEEMEEIKEVAELSEEEFKNKILKWFKDRGLLSEIRSHLRYQMITFLKDTEIGSALSTNVPKTFSSKLRAIHFLIAEFLLHAQHYYSLSIFVSEVPFLNVFPQMTSRKSTLKVLQSPDSETKIFRFQKDEVLDMLQVLGICKRSYEETQILKVYLKNNDHALLTLILKILLEKTALSESTESLSENVEVIGDENDSIGYRWNSAVQKILKNSFARGSNIYAIKDRILRFFFVEFERIRRDAEEKNKIELIKMKELIEEDVKLKEMSFKQELSYVQDKYQQQVQILKEHEDIIEAEFKKKEKDLKQQLTVKEMQHMNELKLLKEEFNKKDKLIEKFTKDIKHLKTYRVEEHMKEIEQIKTEYKTVLQHLKNKYKKVLDKLQYVENTVQEREHTIWDLHQQMSKQHDMLNETIETQMKEIEHLKQMQQLHNEQMQKEKENSNLYQRKYNEQVNVTKKLNQTIESYKKRLETLYNRFNKFKDEFKKLIIQQKPVKKSSYASYCPKRIHKPKKKSSMPKRKSSSSSDSDTLSFANVIKETQQRLELLENTTKMVEEKYKQNIQSLSQTDQTTNLFKFVPDTLTTDQTGTKLSKTIDFQNFFEQIKQFNNNVSVLSQISSSVPVQDSNQRIKLIPEIGEDITCIQNFEMKPIIREISKNLQISFSQIEDNMNNVSHDVEDFVKNSTKLTEQSDIIENSNLIADKSTDICLIVNKSRSMKLLGDFDEMKKELEIVEEDLLNQISLPISESFNKNELYENLSDTNFSDVSECLNERTELQQKLDNSDISFKTVMDFKTNQDVQEIKSDFVIEEKQKSSEENLLKNEFKMNFQISENRKEIKSDSIIEEKLKSPSKEKLLKTLEDAVLPNTLILEHNNQKKQDEKLEMKVESTVIVSNESIETLANDEEIMQESKDFMATLKDKNSFLIDQTIYQSRENYQELKEESKLPLKTMDIILETDEDTELETIVNVNDEKVNDVNIFNAEDDSDIDYVIEHDIIDRTKSNNYYITYTDQEHNSNLIHVIESVVKQVSSASENSTKDVTNTFLKS